MLDPDRVRLEDESKTLDHTGISAASTDAAFSEPTGGDAPSGSGPDAAHLRIARQLTYVTALVTPVMVIWTVLYVGGLIEAAFTLPFAGLLGFWTLKSDQTLAYEALALNGAGRGSLSLFLRALLRGATPFGIATACVLAAANTYFALDIERNLRTKDREIEQAAFDQAKRAVEEADAPLAQTVAQLAQQMQATNAQMLDADRAIAVALKDRDEAAARHQEAEDTFACEAGGSTCAGASGLPGIKARAQKRHVELSIARKRYDAASALLQQRVSDRQRHAEHAAQIDQKLAAARSELLDAERQRDERIQAALSTDPRVQAARAGYGPAARFIELVRLLAHGPVLVAVLAVKLALLGIELLPLVAALGVARSTLYGPRRTAAQVLAVADAEDAIAESRERKLLAKASLKEIRHDIRAEMQERKLFAKDRLEKVRRGIRADRRADRRYGALLWWASLRKPKGNRHA